MIRLERGGLGGAGCGRFRRLRRAFHGLAGGGGLQALEFFESAVVVAVDRIDAALETIEHSVAVVEDATLGVLIRVVIAARPGNLWVTRWLSAGIE